MVEMILVWLVGPAVLILISYGLGLLLSLLVRKPLSFALAVPLGFLSIVILGCILTRFPATVPYASISIAALAGASLLLCLIWFRDYFHFDRIAGIAGICVYLLSGLPVLAYGKPSWAGWVQLDDTASWFAITNRVMTVGQIGLDAINSTYERLMQIIFGTTGGSLAPDNFNYPLGSFLPFGVMSKVTGIERAWLFQPYLALAAGISAMVIVVIARDFIAKRWVLLCIGIVSMLASTMFSYEMWGGIKEIVILLPLLVLAYLLLTPALGRDRIARYGYSAVALVAMYYIGGKTSLGFVMPVVFVAILVKTYHANRKAFAFLSVFALLGGVAGVALLRAGNNAIGKLFVPVITDPGNLARSLNVLQVMGIWPSQDFRLDPVNKPITFSLIGLALALAVIGIVESIRRDLWIIPALVASCVAVVAYSYYFAGIWITGKAIAVSSPVFVLAALYGAYALWRWFRSVDTLDFGKFKTAHIGMIAALAIALGVLSSDAMTYRNIWIAPYSQVNELRQIGAQFAGQGPALMTEYSVFGARYFLRDEQAEAASELRVHAIPMSDGDQVPKGFAADIGLFDSKTIDAYNLLVLRKSPVASRPPLNYQLVWSGEHFEVWKKIASAPEIKSMLPLGSNFSPGAVPTCDAVQKFLAARAKTDKIYTVARSKTYMISFSEGDLPPKWVPSSAPGAVERTGVGGFSRTFVVDQTGAYDFSLAGAYPGKLKVLIDGNQIFAGHSVFEGNPTLTNVLGSTELSAGSHILTLIYTSPIFLPGGDVNYRFGPIFISSQFAGNTKVKQVSISKIPQLCTQNLDWIATTS